MAAHSSSCSRLLELRCRTGVAAKPRNENFASRKPCLCTCDLVKPTQRLQRVLHSASLSGGLSKSASEDAADNSSLPFSLEDAQEYLTELQLLVALLPPNLREPLLARPNLPQLLEVVLDLGRPPVARFPAGDSRLAEEPVSQADLDSAVDKVGDFGDDNRAGIDRTLHRISCMRNRDGAIVGLTCRVGRAITGCASLAADLAMAGKSLLILGKPGVGKTTAIRELARLLSDECQKRVVIVDTSNEIGGDGDIPHSGVGTSRRMQVARTEEQHRVMIEAVENHMPEVIVIDEIGTEAEALAARTIAQRGVQLIATAHGGHLENIMKNPALLDLTGGIQSVTLGDDEARRRRTRKTIRERAAPPTFDAAIELLERRKWRVYPHLSNAVDQLLLGHDPPAELREQDKDGMVHRSSPGQIDYEAEDAFVQQRSSDLPPTHPAHRLRGATHILEEDTGRWQGSSSKSQDSSVQPLFVYSIGLEHSRVLQALQALGQRGERLILSHSLESADVVLAMRSQMRNGSWARDAAKSAGVPVYAVKNSSASHLVRALETLLGLQPSAGSLFESESSDEEGVQYQSHVVSMSAAKNEAEALEEARQAVEKLVLPSNKPIELLPRAQEVLEKQAALIDGLFGLSTEVIGNGLQSRLRILPHELAESVDASLLEDLGV